jgi:hypothetical protein
VQGCHALFVDLDLARTGTPNRDRLFGVQWPDFGITGKVLNLEFHGVHGVSVRCRFVNEAAIRVS